MIAALAPVALVLALLVSALAALRTLQRRFGLGAEVTRKLLHVTMGLVALIFPWLFGAVWQVALLAVSAGVLFAAIRFQPALRAGVGSVIHAVARASWGEFHYAAGVLVAFAVARDDPTTYTVAVLALAVADPAAAWVGMAVRRPLFWRGDGTKTVQGSAVFLVTSFVMTFAVLAADGSGADVLLVAAVLALALMAAEAATTLGLDNLLVPTCAVVLLPSLGDLGPGTLAPILAALAASTLGWWGMAGRRAGSPQGSAVRPRSR